MLARRAVLVATLLAACGGDDRGTTAYFDVDGQWADDDTFFDHPFPSDLRVDSEGRPVLVGFPNPRDVEILVSVNDIADDRVGFPAQAASYFRFDAPIPPQDPGVVLPADTAQNIFLIEVGDSPTAGTAFPIIAQTLMEEEWSPSYMLAVGPRPGIILEGGKTYAVVVRRELGDAAGELLDRPKALAALARGDTPSGSLGAAAAALYEPLWLTLDALGVARDDVAVANVFTTSDVVADMHDLTNALLDDYDVSIENIALDPDDGVDHDRYCELLATVDLPQFQVGTPPFNSEGLFDIGADGLPVLQRLEQATVVITIPKTEMPAGGFPLMMYFHGSGGVAAAVVDAGPRTSAGGPLAKGEGPAHVVAQHGIASAGAALPLSPDRLPGAGTLEYLNFNNLAAFRDTFRQGTIESRLILEALLTLEIPPSALTGCDGPTLPAGETMFKFSPGNVVASGQSMGGMYTNLVSPIEPLIRAAVPTGAGGYWSFFILETSVVPGARDLVAILLGTDPTKLTALHPGMQSLNMAWADVEPFTYMPRIARRPLPGHTPRPIYQPVGQDDGFFPTPIFDAAVLAYGHPQSGTEHWPEMQQVLSIVGLDGLLDYPISQNLSSESGDPYTGIAVQYPRDEFRDGHYIYAQRPEVKYQYGCFLRSFLATGVATVPAPAAEGTPCPGL